MKKNLCGIIICMLIISLFPLSVGSADLRAYGYGDTRAEAEQNARVALLESIRVDVESTFVSLTSDTGEGLFYSISDKTKQTSSGTLLGAEIESSELSSDGGWSAICVIRVDKIPSYEAESEARIIDIGEIEERIPDLRSVEAMKAARSLQLQYYAQWEFADEVLRRLGAAPEKGPSVSFVKIKAELGSLLHQDNADLEKALREQQNQILNAATEKAIEGLNQQLEANRLAQEQLERANQEERERAMAMLDAVLLEKYSQMIASLAKHTRDLETKRVDYNDIEDYVDALEDARSRLWQLTLLENSDLREVLNLHDSVIQQERDRILNEPYDALLEIGKDGKPVAAAVTKRNRKVADAISQLLDKSNQAIREALAIRNATYYTIGQEYDGRVSGLERVVFSNDSKNDIYGSLEIGRWDASKRSWPFAFSSRILTEDFSYSGELKYDDVGLFAFVPIDWTNNSEYLLDVRLLDAFFKAADSLILDYTYKLSWDPLTRRYTIKDFDIHLRRMDTNTTVLIKKNVLLFGIKSKIPPLAIQGYGTGISVADSENAAISNLVGRFSASGTLPSGSYTVTTEKKDGYVVSTCSVGEEKSNYILSDAKSVNEKFPITPKDQATLERIRGYYDQWDVDKGILTIFGISHYVPRNFNKSLAEVEYELQKEAVRRQEQEELNRQQQEARRVQEAKENEENLMRKSLLDKYEMYLEQDLVGALGPEVVRPKTSGFSSASAVAALKGNIASALKMRKQLASDGNPYESTIKQLEKSQERYAELYTLLVRTNSEVFTIDTQHDNVKMVMKPFMMNNSSFKFSIEFDLFGKKYQVPVSVPVSALTQTSYSTSIGEADLDAYLQKTLQYYSQIKYRDLLGCSLDFKFIADTYGNEFLLQVTSIRVYRLDTNQKIYEQNSGFSSFKKVSIDSVVLMGSSAIKSLIEQKKRILAEDTQTLDEVHLGVILSAGFSPEMSLLNGFGINGPYYSASLMAYQPFLGFADKPQTLYSIGVGVNGYVKYPVWKVKDKRLNVLVGVELAGVIGFEAFNPVDDGSHGFGKAFGSAYGGISVNPAASFEIGITYGQSFRWWGLDGKEFFDNPRSLRIFLIRRYIHDR